MADPARHQRREGVLLLFAASAPFVLFLLVPVAALLGHVPLPVLLRHLGSQTARQALLLTLQTTTVATALTVVLGTPVAYLLARFEFRGREVLDTVIDLPLTVPPVVVGLALLLTFGRFGLVGRHLDALGLEIGFTRTAVVLAQLAIASPFYVRTARAGFASVDPRLEHAAWLLGASRLRAFFTVCVPLARPALFAGTVLAWGRALSEFGATVTFAGNFPGRTQTLSLAVMSALETDISTAVAVSTLSLAVGAGALLLARASARRWFWR